MQTDHFLPYDRVITKEGIVFEMQSGYQSGDKSLIVRPKFFPKKLYEGNIGEVYDCENDLFKIPVTPQLYILSGRIIRSVNNKYCIPELEEIGIREYYDVPLEQIVEHFTPKDRTPVRKTPRNQVEENAQQLLRLLDSEGLLEIVGLGGSMMMGLSSNYSDIDLVIYGQDNVEDVTTALHKIINISSRTERELGERYNKLSSQLRAFISFEEYFTHESIKKQRGYVKGVKLTINVVDPDNHPSVIWGPFDELVELSGEVVDDTHSLTHPSKLLIQVPDISDITMISLSRIFSDQVKQGDECSMRGYLCSNERTLVVHDSFGGIKKKSI